QRPARVPDREPDPRQETVFHTVLWHSVSGGFGGLRRALPLGSRRLAGHLPLPRISSLRAWAFNADGTPLGFLRRTRSFCRRNGRNRVVSEIGAFGFRHSETFTPYSLVQLRLAAMKRITSSASAWLPA